jgi:hypothetical protein
MFLSIYQIYLSLIIQVQYVSCHLILVIYLFLGLTSFYDDF